MAWINPFWFNIFFWIRNVLTGNLGFSLVSQSSISQELATRIPNSMRASDPCIFDRLYCWRSFSGLLTAANKGKIWDRIIDAVASLGDRRADLLVCDDLDLCIWLLIEYVPIIGMYTVERRGFWRFSAALYFALYHIDCCLLPRFDKVYSGISRLSKYQKTT